VLLGLLGKIVKPANAPSTGGNIQSTNTGSEQSPPNVSPPVPTQPSAQPQPPLLSVPC
jgi:hypothetical protein